MSTETSHAWELPAAWREMLAEETAKPSWGKLREFVAQERQAGPVHPPEEDLFTALRLTPPERVRVVILGQDPYHGPGQAHGLSFSVREGVKKPPSLANIFKEYAADLGFPVPKSGSLTAWAERGVLLLNAVLTVREGDAGSHRNRGWEAFTDAIVRGVDRDPRRKVFILWGSDAQKKAAHVDRKRHAILSSVHPSPLSAARGFFGSKPFSWANDRFKEWGEPPLEWRLP